MTSSRLLRASVLVVLAAAACGSVETEPDGDATAPPDTTEVDTDAATEVDAATDGDAATDAAVDAAPGPTLGVVLAGQGTGRVTGSGIDCGTTCTRSFLDGETVALTATPGADSAFGRWLSTGPCNGSTSPTCSFTIDVDTSLTAELVPDFVLSLQVGPFHGLVNVSGRAPCSNGASSTSTTCTYHAATAQGLTLQAVASSADCERFTGWSGACTGTASSCTLTLDHALGVTAGFAKITGCVPQ